MSTGCYVGVFCIPNPVDWCQIETATNTVIGSPIPVGTEPFSVAVTPGGSKVYVTNAVGNT